MRGKSEGSQKAAQKARDMRRIDAAIQKAMFRPKGEQMPYEMQKYLAAQVITSIIDKNPSRTVPMGLFLIVKDLTGCSEVVD